MSCVVTRRVLRCTTALLVAVTGLLVAPTEPAHAAGERAGVVVGGAAAIATFDGSITGLDALRQVASVATSSYAGQGTAVCSINGVGNPATPSDCLVGPNGEYWQYWRKAPGAASWSYSGTCACATSVSERGMEGWVYAVARTPPPDYAFCSIAACPPPTTAPPAGGTDAPAPGGGTTGSGSTGTTASGGGPTAAAPGPAADAADPSATTTTAARTEVALGSGGWRSGGTLRIPPDDDDPGSPVGTIVAGTGVAGLAVGGVWLRRRRRGMLSTMRGDE